jgi:hypothetical protein
MQRVRPAGPRRSPRCVVQSERSVKEERAYRSADVPGIDTSSAARTFVSTTGGGRSNRAARSLASFCLSHQRQQCVRCLYSTRENIKMLSGKKGKISKSAQDSRPSRAACSLASYLPAVNARQAGRRRVQDRTAHALALARQETHVWSAHPGSGRSFVRGEAERVDISSLKPTERESYPVHLVARRCSAGDGSV